MHRHLSIAYDAYKQVKVQNNMGTMWLKHSVLVFSKLATVVITGDT